eukprot:3909341-Lingulodinium_polyedra.AAC.1
MDECQSLAADAAESSVQRANCRAGLGFTMPLVLAFAWRVPCPGGLYSWLIPVHERQDRLHRCERE